LPDELCEPLWTELQLKGRIVLNGRGGNQAVALVAEVRSISQRGHGKAIVKRKSRLSNCGFAESGS